MSEADERDAIAIRSQEARRWLAIVEEDLDVARASIDLAHPRHGSAAYHLQQACEKVLKCLLVLAGERLPRTHDLDDLASRVTTLHPGWKSSFDAMRELSTWGIAYRYPSLGQMPEPEPSRAELVAVADMVERLASAVERDIP